MQKDLLLNKIASELQIICQEYHFEKINELVFEISYDNDLDSDDLHTGLCKALPDLVNDCTMISIKKRNLEKGNIVIYLLKGVGFAS